MLVAVAATTLLLTQQMPVADVASKVKAVAVVSKASSVAAVCSVVEKEEPKRQLLAWAVVSTVVAALSVQVQVQVLAAEVSAAEVSAAEVSAAAVALVVVVMAVHCVRDVLAGSLLQGRVLTVERFHTRLKPRAMELDFHQLTPTRTTRLVHHATSCQRTHHRSVTKPNYRVDEIQTRCNESCSVFFVVG